MQIDGKNTEALLVARLLRNVNVDFLWTMRSEPIDWQAVQRKQMVNRFPRAYFTTKVIYTQLFITEVTNTIIITSIHMYYIRIMFI